MLLLFSTPDSPFSIPGSTPFPIPHSRFPGLNYSRFLNHSPFPIPDSPLLILIAGEASGDLLGAGLIKALRERFPEARFAGIGGPQMIAAGLDAWYPAEKGDGAGRGAAPLAELLRHPT